MRSNKIYHPESMRRYWYKKQDKRFDKKYGIVTDLHKITNIVSLEGMVIPENESGGGIPKGMKPVM